MSVDFALEDILTQALGLPDHVSATQSDSQVRVPYAEKEGQLVHVSTVERGLKCNAVCPVCKTAVVARKGAKVRHHFAHYPGANCNAETVLHFIAKQLIYEKLRAAIDLKQVMQISWKCIACSHRHSLNLLENVCRVALEKKLDNCRPDISLLDSDNQARALLEIVVSHRPDRKIIEYCNERNIPLLIFRIANAEALEQIGLYRNLNPSVVLYCLRDRCPKCGAPLFEKRLFTINNSCWRCGAPMKLAAMKINNKLYGITHFSEADCLIAREKGIIFREHFNKKSRQRELAVACPNCGVVTSNRFVGFQKRMVQKQSGIYRGKICLNCRTHTDEVSQEDS
jgi:ssDNA-binding Zn-finger/Zn-ribbon topoisomerase 1